MRQNFQYINMQLNLATFELKISKNNLFHQRWESSANKGLISLESENAHKLYKFYFNKIWPALVLLSATANMLETYNEEV